MSEIFIHMFSQSSHESLSFFFFFAIFRFHCVVCYNGTIQTMKILSLYLQWQKLVYKPELGDPFWFQSSIAIFLFPGIVLLSSLCMFKSETFASFFVNPYYFQVVFLHNTYTPLYVNLLHWLIYNFIYLHAMKIDILLSCYF